MSRYRFTQTKMLGLVCTMILGPSVVVCAGPNTDANAPASSKERLQAMDQAMTRLCQMTTQLQQRLDPALRACESFNAERQLDLIHKEEEKKRLHDQAEQLNRQIAEIEALLGSIQPGDSNVPGKVAKARARQKWLAEEIAKYPDPCDSKGNPKFVTVPEEMKPVSFVLYGNRITPVDDEHFSGRVVVLLGKRYVFIEKKQDGQPVGEALNRGGCLAARLSMIDPEKEYVMLLICADSISLFEPAVKKIKDKKINGRSIRCVWTPASDPPWVISSDAGGKSPGLPGF